MAVIVRSTHRADQVAVIPRALIEQVNAILDARFAAREDNVRAACWAGVPRGLGWSRCRAAIESPCYIPHTPVASRPASLRYLCAAHEQAEQLVVPAPGQERGWGA